MAKAKVKVEKTEPSAPEPSEPSEGSQDFPAQEEQERQEGERERSDDPESNPLLSDFLDYEDPTLSDEQFAQAYEGNLKKLEQIELARRETPSRMAYRKKIRAGQRFLVDTILPSGALHLIGGPSGIGKTTWMLQLLKDWSEGRKILGSYESHPVPWVYISCDRSTSETDATLNRIGLGDWDCPVFAIEEVADEPSIEVIINRWPNAELYVIEGLQSLLPDGKGNQNRADMIWAMKVRKGLLAKGKTIIGTTHSPKSEWGKHMRDGRSGFLGSASLHACFSTMILFDLPQSARESKVPVVTDDREITVMGRNFRDFKVGYTRDSQGRFVPLTQTSEIEAEIAIDTFFSLIPAGKTFNTKELEAKARQYKMSRRKMFYWLEDLLGPEKDEKGNIIRPPRIWKVKYGGYRKAFPDETMQDYRKQVPHFLQFDHAKARVHKVDPKE